jgi:hypothetical protein
VTVTSPASCRRRAPENARHRGVTKFDARTRSGSLRFGH